MTGADEEHPVARAVQQLTAVGGVDERACGADFQRRVEHGRDPTLPLTQVPAVQVEDTGGHRGSVPDGRQPIKGVPDEAHHRTVTPPGALLRGPEWI
ncbi:hypothetical protein GCM10017556_58930 [Micromonospora sagamiensis]|nr:hypothetical protein GCM10017556_00130 [Micromonospora sagamiensis]BCL18154.1 hypothetical protein GCM10017556_58930 [Micromonospora sagamiensis]